MKQPRHKGKAMLPELETPKLWSMSCGTMRVT